MKVGIAQVNTKVGDLQHNQDIILNAISQMGKSSDVIVFPELTTCGYPPKDLLFDLDFVQQQKEIIYKVRDLVKSINTRLKVLLGYVDYDETINNEYGDFQKFNSCAVIGSDIKYYNKQLLPSYDVFNEYRYFTPGTQNLTINVATETAGLLICEDMWDTNYQNKPIQKYFQKSVGNLFNLSASPFAVGKLRQRFELARSHIDNSSNPLRFVYVNQVGAQDELVFDGGSFVIGKSGFVKYLAPCFQQSLEVIDLDNSASTYQQDNLFQQSGCENNQILSALKLGLSDYLKKSSLNNVLLGVSGGIDSAVCAYIISKVVDKSNIEFVYLPTSHSKSLDDAKQLTQNLGFSLNVIDIDDFVKSFSSTSLHCFGANLDGLAYENTQARIRGNILMMRANQIKGMVVNTSNKTEAALGYGTLYGDLIGGLSLIGDLNKTQVYQLAIYINQIEGKTIIPTNIINKSPSAELSDGQVDPFDYEKISYLVDDLLFGGNIHQLSIKYGVDINEILEYKKLIRNNEFKRRQSPPVIKLFAKSIGTGRQYPIV